jgi:hypothetical protein
LGALNLDKRPVEWMHVLGRLAPANWGHRMFNNR